MLQFVYMGGSCGLGQDTVQQVMPGMTELCSYCVSAAIPRRLSLALNYMTGSRRAHPPASISRHQAGYLMCSSTAGIRCSASSGPASALGAGCSSELGCMR